MSGLSPAEQAQINISVGGVVVSNYFSYLTMGIVLSAAWIYFSKFPNDTWWLRSLVILCVSLCIGDTIATGVWSYDWAVANYANPAAMAFIPWAVVVEPFLFATCGLTVQLFYAWRLWTMTMKKNWILPGVIGCLSILGWCTICWQVNILATHKLISDLRLLLPVAWVWLGGSVGADVLITSSMIYYLDLRFRIKRHKTQQNQASYHAPRRFRQIIVWTVECNLLSLLAQTITIAFFNESSIGFSFVMTNMVLAKVYTFSLLVSLNIRHSDNDHGTSDGGFYSSRGRGGPESTALSIRHGTVAFPSTQVTVDIQQETTANWQAKGPAFNADEI
ncbi:hypothetical protein BT96DRAFT_922838 [Gymnopus androsaceus JB14]|uniref:DUF6534 domain-containing protein n=1 Tax=Gymnopus androsaceus JB14 TaxID=1447944 RepID=A0A6A4HE74_9AGAR|nr:hypothetical protein BT96DRAFT_922838 [Gymnopus androsaceus JB14]